jgi:hypothetical protein
MPGRAALHAIMSFEYEPCWASQLVKGFNLRVRLLSEKARRIDIQDDAIIWGKSRESVENALEFLRKYPHIFRLKIVKRSRDGLLVRIRVNIRRQICPLYGAFQLYSTTKKEPILERVDFSGKTTWTLDTKRVDRVSELLCEKFKVKNLQTKPRPDRRGMKKSVFLLKEAYERGYFDVPKGTSLRQVAREIGVPVSTLSTDVRRTLEDIVDKATR